MSKPDNETIVRMHRWFAVECNNHAWDLAAKDNRSEAEDREMLLAASAAAFHWSKVGQPIHDARADVLLAQVCSQLGDGTLALRFARRGMEFCQQHDCEDWDLAFAHAEMAYACAVDGDGRQHREHFEQAKRLGAAIKDDADREIFLKELDRIAQRTETAGRRSTR